MSQESQNPIRSLKSLTITINQFMARKAALVSQSVSVKLVLHHVWSVQQRTSPSWLRPTTIYRSCFTLKKNSPNNNKSQNLPMYSKSSHTSSFSCQWFLQRSLVFNWLESCNWLTSLWHNKTILTFYWNPSWRWTKSTVSMLTGLHKISNFLIKCQLWASKLSSSTTATLCYFWFSLKSWQPVYCLVWVIWWVQYHRNCHQSQNTWSKKVCWLWWCSTLLTLLLALAFISSMLIKMTDLTRWVLLLHYWRQVSFLEFVPCWCLRKENSSESSKTNSNQLWCVSFISCFHWGTDTLSVTTLLSKISTFSLLW